LCVIALPSRQINIEVDLLCLCPGAVVTTVAKSPH